MPKPFGDRHHSGFSEQSEQVLRPLHSWLRLSGDTALVPLSPLISKPRLGRFYPLPSCVGRRSCRLLPHCRDEGRPMSETTRVLSALEQGDPHAAEQLLPPPSFHGSARERDSVKRTP